MKSFVKDLQPGCLTHVRVHVRPAAVDRKWIASSSVKSPLRKIPDTDVAVSLTADGGQTRVAEEHRSIETFEATSDERDAVFSRFQIPHRRWRMVQTSYHELLTVR